jgi:transposase-like protein
MFDPHPPKPTLHLCAFFPDAIERALTMYMSGVAIEAICQVVCLSEREVNFILDHYAPFLDEA